MKTSTLVRYQLHDAKSSLIIYYGVIVCILLLSFFTSAVLLNGPDASQGTLNGMESATAIFLFVCGIASFTEYFHMFLQNGVTRKKALQGMLLFQLILSVVAAVIDSILFSVSNLISTNLSLVSMSTQSLFGQIYRGYAQETSRVVFFLVQFVFILLVNLFFISLGHLIAMFYYRAPRSLKIAVSVGVPVFLFLLLPILDYVVFHSSLTSTFIRFMDSCFGVSRQIPGIAMITLAVSTAVTVLLRYLLMRRACKR